MKKTFIINGEAVTVENLMVSEESVSFTLGDNHYAMAGDVNAEGVVRLHALNHNQRGFVGNKLAKGGQPVFLKGLEAIIQLPEMGRKQSHGMGKTAAHRAPMPGKIQKILVGVGDVVEVGQHLVVMEAMKLQLTIEAVYAGTITELFYASGDLVAEGELLVKVEKPHAE